MTWEDTFKSWGSPPSKTEREKMENAETAIRKAIKADTTLSSMDISIIPQGSYRSKTNVKQDSDVDICVCLNSTFFTRYPEGKTNESYGNSDSSISFGYFKNLVQKALENYFGIDRVTRGNKAFDIHSNSYSVDADVVPAFAYRFYYGDGMNQYIQPTGIGFDTDDGTRIINWPEQAYTNCLDKQNKTGERYRKMARIVKRLRNKMQDENISAAKDIPSFLLQSMVWNVPSQNFNNDTYTADVRQVLAFGFNETLPTGSHADLKEVNGRKKIFGSHQPTSREKVHNFFSAAWDHIGFK